ncbi:MAG: hypothetical protein ACRC6M_13580 [Microcystaceae cyanobacterium]
MSFSFSDLGNLKVESLIQQGLDTILKRQSDEQNKTGQTHGGSPQLRKRSLDNKAELYELPPTHSVTLAAYQIRRKGSKGSILVIMEHLKKLYQSLNQEILAAAAKGDLPTAEKLWQQQKNVDITHYTHRLKVFRVNQSKILDLIIDLDLHTEKTSEKSYGSGTAKSLLDALMTYFLDEPNALSSRQDYLDCLVSDDWLKHLTEVAKPFYKERSLTYKTVFRKPPRFSI